MSSRENVEGIPLMRQGEDDDYVSEYEHATSPSSKQQSSHAVRRATSALPYAACLIAFLSFVFNALNFSQNPKLDVFKGNVVHSLRKPSLYLGIDRVPDIKEMLSLETLFTQNHTTATDSSPNTTHSHGSSTGDSPTDNADYSGDVARVNSRYPNLIFPQDGWVILSEHDRTILKFHPSSASSQCILSSSFPERKALGDKLLTIEIDDSTLKIPRIQAVLLSNAAVNLSTLTWDTLPSRAQAIGQLEANFGRNSSTGQFTCGDNGPLLVELRCIGSGCRVEYKQSGNNIVTGSYITLSY